MGCGKGAVFQRARRGAERAERMKGPKVFRNTMGIDVKKCILACSMKADFH